MLVHLLDPDDALVAQADGSLIGGDHPTQFRSPGQVIADERPISTKGLPPATYHLRVGMCLLESGEHLPATDADGSGLLDDAVPLAEVNLP